MAYNLSRLKAPRLKGSAFALFTSILESSFPGKSIAAKLLKDSGITGFTKKTITEDPTILPLHLGFKSRKGADKSVKSFLKAKKGKRAGFTEGGDLRPYTIDDYAVLYRKGVTTPEAVAERLVSLIQESDSGEKPLKAVIKMDVEDLLDQAKKSTERHKAGKPLSILDGVPICVKDEINQRGYTTSVGTSFLGKDKADEDAEIVHRLRKAGAILFGKTNMHEIGIGVTGLNPHFGVTRNPYNPDHYTGGSSSGSAAAVAAGLCPGSVGADGGGSIRIPAAFCGVTGLKPTYARLSEHGAAPLCWSVAHLGPIAATVRDTAILYAVMAGKDEKMEASSIQPDVDLEKVGTENLEEIVIGYYPQWFYDCNESLHPALNKAVETLKELGAEIVEVEIPELEEMRVAQLISIVSEMAAAMNPYYDKHKKDFGLDTRTNLALGRNMTNIDYIQAQRMRTRAINIFNKTFETVDAIISPMTAVPPPPIPEDALPKGESNLPLLSEIMRYAPMGNLTGLPAVSVPIGYTEVNLPVGMQIMGKAWQESLLLRIAYNLEKNMSYKKPTVYLSPLGDLLSD